MVAPTDARAIPDGGKPVAGLSPYTESGWVDRAVAHERIGRCESRPLLERILVELERRVRDEEDRQATLERKAATLMGVIGLCISILVSLGAPEPRALAPASTPTWLVITTLVSVGATALFGLAAAFFAVRTLQTRSHDRTSDEIVLNDYAIRATQDAEAGREHVLLEYLQLLVRGSWDVANTTRIINDDKAKSVHQAQRAFLLFLLGVLVLGVGSILRVALSG